MKKSEHPDPFLEKRQSHGIGHMEDQEDPITMVLRLKDVRKCAHMWESFQSGAEPGRIVIPSEVIIRDTRQLPFELDPPEHTEFRKLLEPWFRRPHNTDYQERLEGIIYTEVSKVVEEGKFDVVSDLALIVQSRALTVLLNIPLEEAETWISWGTHVFRSEDDPLDGDKAEILYNYIDEAIDKAAAEPGEDLYSELLNSEASGVRLTREQIRGIMILSFAGGRDTVINALTNSVAYFADHPQALRRIREEPEIRSRAVEELLRYFSPLTQMGRVVTQDEIVCDHAVKSDTRISLCWASANRDETTFEKPNEVIIDRKMNPHVSFGFGRHKCLGAHHARAVIDTFIKILAEEVRSVEILEMTENIEKLGEFNRKVGYDSLLVRFVSEANKH